MSREEKLVLVKQSKKGSMTTIVLILLGGLLLGGSIAAASLVIYDATFRDQGGPIFSTASPQAMEDMVSTFAEYGVPPKVWLPSFTGSGSLVLVDRAGMIGGALINYSSQAFRRRAVSNAVVGYQFVTSTPHVDAATAAYCFELPSYSVTVVEDPDPMLEPGKMAFVIVRGLLDNDQPFVFVFRRHKTKMVRGKPFSWSLRPTDLKYAK